LGVLLVAAGGPSALAQASFRALYVGYHPSQGLESQETALIDPFTVQKSSLAYQAGASSGPALEFSQRFGRWLGYTVHLSYCTLEFSRHEETREIDSEGQSTALTGVSDISDETVFIPLIGIFDLHFLPPGRVDLYAGPLVGYTWYDELFSGWVDDHFIYGFGGGIDVSLGRHWGLSAALRYIQAEAEPREGGPILNGTGEINVDPWQVELGIVYRFGATSL